MIATSTVLAMDVTPVDLQAAFDLDRRMISRVLAERHDLSADGFWAKDCQTPGAFAAGRVALLDLRHIGQFERAVAFILLSCGRRKTLNRRATSYVLKHAAERAMRALNVPDYYVSNGAFICAAIALGHRVEHIPGTPNAYLDLNVIRERCQ